MSRKRKQPEQLKYTGFSKPESNFFKMPNDWPNITAKITSLAELKVVEYVLRHTWGYQEYDISKRITNDEFMKGRKNKNGERIDNGTGLSKSSVIDGLRRAVSHGLLIEEINDRDKARIKKYYKLNMKSPKGENNSGVEKLYPGVKKIYPSSKENIPRTEKETIERNNKKDVVVKLSDFGISDERIQEIISNYQTSYITKKLEILEWKLGGKTPGRPIKDPAAWLIKAIENDYKPPEGFKPLAELKKGKEEERLMQEEMETERQAERDREKEQRAKVIDAYQIPDEILGVWRRVLEGINSAGNYQELLIRLENSIMRSIENDVATILVEDSDDQQWLEDRAKSILRNELTGYLGNSVKVRFEVIGSDE